MKKIRSHVDLLFSDIPASKKTDLLKEDIIQNLEDKVMDLMDEGKAEEDAINKAIVEFGDMEDLKSELRPEAYAVDDRKNQLARLNLGFSIWGSLLLIGLFLFLNFYYTPKTIWFVYPTFAVLWWPLSMYYYWRRNGGRVG
ncbi:permease prefix domain 1-containing protein [Bacillus sp. 1P06AnD]|uniref:permease prefix domain 1-containing protein n=1 Tax=Bacillus sp. 1P06AnD TaxID=3132208 RepID=UPI0039A2D184